jgi:hypothetical protein
MISCKGYSLAKIQQLSLLSINRVPHKHFAYDTVLRNLHCERPNEISCSHQRALCSTWYAWFASSAFWFMPLMYSARKKWDRCFYKVFTGCEVQQRISLKKGERLVGARCVARRVNARRRSGWAGPIRTNLFAFFLFPFSVNFKILIIKHVHMHISCNACLN